jgi:hypothetical protein
MSQQITRPVYNLGDAVMSAWIYNFIKNHPQKAQDETITMYYKLQNSDGSTNATETKFVCDPLNGPYRGIENRLMTNATYSSYNTNIMTFIGYRTPGATVVGQNIPPLYNETINILVAPYEQNFIQASANYIDSGEQFETTASFIKYTVSAASGIFEGYTTITIYFFNNRPGKQRIVKIAK